MNNIVANVFVDVHSSAAKITLLLGGNCFCNASTVRVYLFSKYCDRCWLTEAPTRCIMYYMAVIAVGSIDYFQVSCSKFGSYEVLRCQFGEFGLSIELIYVRSKCRIWISFVIILLYFFDCHVSSVWPKLLHEQLPLSIPKLPTLLLFPLFNLPFCQQVLPHWAGPIFWCMAKNLMTKNQYDARATGLLNCVVQIELPWRHMSRNIPSNRIHKFNIIEAFEESNIIWKVRLPKLQIKKRSFLKDIVSPARRY